MVRLMLRTIQRLSLGTVFSVGVAFLSVSCGPSAEQLACFDDCASQKDSCVLGAKGTSEIQACDAVGRYCDDTCR